MLSIDTHEGDKEFNIPDLSEDNDYSNEMLETGDNPYFTKE